MTALALLASTALAGVPGIGGVDLGPACRPIPTGAHRDLPEGVPGNALRRRIVNVSGAEGAPGDPVHPDALCNDGSPGTYYVRAGDEVDGDRWILHLDGGYNAMGSPGRLLDRIKAGA